MIIPAAGRSPPGPARPRSARWDWRSRWTQRRADNPRPARAYPRPAPRSRRRGRTIAPTGIETVAMSGNSSGLGCFKKARRTHAPSISSGNHCHPTSCSGFNAVMGGERLAQLRRLGIGIEPHCVGCGGSHRYQRKRRWAKRAFVGVEFYKIGDARLLAGHIGRKLTRDRAPERVHRSVRVGVERRLMPSPDRLRQPAMLIPPGSRGDEVSG